MFGRSVKRNVSLSGLQAQWSATRGWSRPFQSTVIRGSPTKASTIASEPKRAWPTRAPPHLRRTGEEFDSVARVQAMARHNRQNAAKLGAGRPHVDRSRVDPSWVVTSSVWMSGRGVRPGYPAYYRPFRDAAPPLPKRKATGWEASTWTAQAGTPPSRGTSSSSSPCSCSS